MPDAHDALRLREGQRAQNDGVHDGEDRRIDADAKPEDDDRGEREAWALDQPSRAVVKITNQGLNHGHPSSIAIRFFGLLDASERDERTTPRFVCGHAEAHVVVDVELQMALELVGELAIGSRRSHEAYQSDQRCADASHGSLTRGTGAPVGAMLTARRQPESAP